MFLHTAVKLRHAVSSLPGTSLLYELPQIPQNDDVIVYRICRFQTMNSCGHTLLEDDDCTRCHVLQTIQLESQLRELRDQPVFAPHADCVS